jgi:hypothetical protein
LTMAKDEPPTVETKYELVQSVGSRLFNQGNSCRSSRDERPFIRLISEWMPNCGSTSTSTCTWSGITSNSMSSECVSSATSRKIAFRRSSTPLTRTLRRYFDEVEFKQIFCRFKNCF